MTRQPRPGVAVTPCTRCPLRALPTFKPVSRGELTWIQANKRAERGFPRGATLVEEGGQTRRVFTLLSGWAFRFKTLTDGRRQILNILLPGDLAGLQASLMDVAPHGIEALTDVRLCTFRDAAMEDLMREHPKLGLDVTWLAAQGERLTDDVLLSVGRRNALERVAMLLVYLYKRAGSAGLITGGALAFPLTQAHIADTLGLSFVHTNRCIQRLRKLGLIQLDKGQLQVNDLRLLRRVAEYWEQPAPSRPLL